nr:MAG TPA: hypothetical protein [Caudoviricetes sp.]
MPGIYFKEEYCLKNVWKNHPSHYMKKKFSRGNHLFFEELLKKEKICVIIIM